MSTQRQRTLRGNPPAPHGENRQAVNNPGRRFPVHHEIQKLQEKLAAFNERIAELEDERSSGPCDGSAEGQRNRFRAADR